MNIEKAAEALWNLHAQTRSWDELDEIEKEQMRLEAKFVIDAAQEDDIEAALLKVDSTPSHEFAQGFRAGYKAVK